MKRQPLLPIPEPIRGRRPGTWAHSTIIERLPDIARRVLEENPFPPEVEARIEALIDDIPAAGIRPLEDPGAPDLEAWNAWVAPHQGQDWLEIPWFLAETYFYRRLLEGTGYFRSGPTKGQDPFYYEKRRGLESTRDAVQALTGAVGDSTVAGTLTEATLARLLRADLWGNRADLSLWPADPSEDEREGGFDQADSFLLVSDLEAVIEHIDAIAPRTSRVDFVADNAGFELVADLCLADYLLVSRKARVVRLHLKSHPTFVSDATITDLLDTLAHLADSDHPAVREMAARLNEGLRDRRLQPVTDPYWTSPLCGWQMPEDLYAELAESMLVVFKGDANYRRLLGDRRWAYTTPFEKIVAYFPAPLLALRTLKAELAAGLKASQVEELNRVDPDWLTDGRWGVIQFVPKNTQKSSV